MYVCTVRVRVRVRACVWIHMAHACQLLGFPRELRMPSSATLDELRRLQKRFLGLIPDRVPTWTLTIKFSRADTEDQA